MDKFLINSFLLSLLCVTLLQAQTEKKKMKTSDYCKWGELQKEQISPDGNWVSFYMKYQNDLDTLYLTNPKTGIKYNFPKGSNGRFSTDGKWFTLRDYGKGLGIFNLTKGLVKWISDVDKFEFLTNTNSLVVKSNGAPALRVINLLTGYTENFENVNDFSISSKGVIGAVSDNEVKLISFSNKYLETSVIKGSNGKYKNIVWNDAGTMIAFLEEMPLNKNHKIYCYLLQKNNLLCLDPLVEKDLNEYRIIARAGSMQIFFSPASDRIFFYYAGFDTQEKEIDNVEIWDTSLPLDYPEQKFLGNTDHLSKIGNWNLSTNKISKLGTNELPNIKLSVDKKTAIAYNNLQYEPQFALHAPVDIYLLDTETLSKTLLIEKQEISAATFSASPDASKFAYFKSGNWWIYDRNNKTHTNATSHIQTDLTNKDDFNIGSPESYGVEGWTKDSEFLIVYDKFDIWLVSSNVEKSRKITDGRESKIQYRVAKSLSEDYVPFSSVNLGKKHLDISKGLLLEAHAFNKKSGYAIWKSNNKLNWIVFGQNEYSNLYKASECDSYIYTEQTFNIPPRLKYWNKKEKKEHLIYQSNPHYQQYHNGKAELISYNTDTFADLQGVLYYPIGFNPEQKYPMIVYVYQKLSDTLHHYINPTLFVNDGFNIPNFTNDGYFVLLPDIRYEIGEPGKSALECTTAAVNKVLEKGIVKQDDIGLIGHSFGGYEVSFIITQTNLFAVAVAGAGITDLISNYFTMHWDNEHSNMWRYEKQQLRMGTIPFDNYNSYLRNSPIAQADKIETPLLSWSGKKDITVNWSQSLELYLAMRRLSKKNMFLVYPEEEHVIIDSKNQIDLSIRIKNWFDKILKSN